MGKVLKVLAALLGVIILGVAVAVAAYFLLIREDDDDGGGDVSGVQVAGVAISNEIDSNGLPVNPRLVLPAGTRAVRATIRLTGAEAGMIVKGTWFQLGTARSGAEGAEVSTSEVVLGDTEIAGDGSTRVSFSLGTSGPSLPSDAWLLRVYVNDKLVKTSGFVIGGTGAQPATSPVPGP